MEREGDGERERGEDHVVIWRQRFRVVVKERLDDRPLREHLTGYGRRVSLTRVVLLPSIVAIKTTAQPSNRLLVTIDDFMCERELACMKRGKRDTRHQNMKHTITT